MRVTHRFVVVCGLLAISSCSRSDSGEVAKLKAELDAAKTETSATKAELAKLKPAEGEHGTS